MFNKISFILWIPLKEGLGDERRSKDKVNLGIFLINCTILFVGN
jgi:hypothetical protein